MAKTVWIALLMLIAALGVPQQAQASSKDKARKEFIQLWQDRLASYRLQRPALAAADQAAANAFQTSEFKFAPGDNRLGNFINATVSNGELSSRGEILTAFVAHMAGKPSLGLTEAWLQSQADVARSEQAQSEQMKDQALAMLTQKVRVIDFLSAIERAALKRGDAIGRAEELQLLTENFSAFAGEYAEADARDRERRSRLAAAFGAMAQSLRANQGWTAQCTTFASTVNCSGN